MLTKKKIVYGVTGSVAAVKAPIIARELQRRGADVHTAVTASAERFTTAYALSVLTQNDSYSEVFPAGKTTWHIHLGRSADAMLIAPCSAVTLGKLRYGIYDNPVLLLAASLREGTPLIIAPAMDEEMWVQPAVQENVQWLRAHGVGVIDPTSGALASGLSGLGRMREPTEVVDTFESILSSPQAKPLLPEALPLQGKNILVTAGPTYEPIDPVRFIGNRSSGKMGAAIADCAALEFGANTTLVMGPSSIPSSDYVQRISVETTDDMAAAVHTHSMQADIIIMSAAVSDYRIADYSDSKLKKTNDTSVLHLELEPTQDILRGISEKKRSSQCIVGFALESRERGAEYAKEKLAKKSLDIIVLNHYDEPDSGFAHDTNRVTIYTKHGMEIALPLMTKKDCAREILSRIIEYIHV